MKVLVCPLDWGLGHAARCVPVVRALLKNRHEVVLGASGGGKRLLRQEFPQLTVFEFPGYRVRYSRSPSLFFPFLLAQLPALLLGWRRERLRLKRIVAEHRPDVIISDGRYGVRARGIPAVFITHQIAFRIPGRFPFRALAERLAFSLNLSLLRGFDQVWVPDFAGTRNLSGELSHKPCRHPGLYFINPLSRFARNGAEGEIDGDSTVVGDDQTVDVLALVSGPEPQRSLFEEALLRELRRLPGTRVLVRGVPGRGAGARSGRKSESKKFRPYLKSGELNVFDHLPGEALRIFIREAGTVVARSGYTTVMELASLGRGNVALIPTPGQTEQEYLADHLEAVKAALRLDQDGLDLSDLSARLAAYPGFADIRSENARTEDGNVSLEAFIQSNELFADAEKT